jgi:acetyl coenzyme A synthetase (ADP forming)-like protein
LLLTEPEVYERLKSYGIRTPKFKVFKKGEVPGWSSFPAAVKIVSREKLHKSSVGGVRIINSQEEFERELKELSENFPDVEEFVVEEKLEGIEAFVGVKRDPSFSHVIGVGTGGIFVELFKDVVFVPLDAEEGEILGALSKTKLFKLIIGFRNFKGNLKKFLEFLEKLKIFIRENPEIYELDLNPTFITPNEVIPADGRALLKEPEEKEKFFSLSQDLFRPKTVAVIGASPNPKKVGYALLRNLEHFKGKVFPVNPKHEEILGFKCFPSVLSVPEKVDCALIAVPALVVPKVLRECGEKDIKLAVVVSAGFGETAEKGKELERELKEISRKFGMRILGPNTLGFMVPPLKLNASFSSTLPPVGDISFLSQSGALITAVVDRAIQEGIGFSEILSLGNQADIELTETLELAVKSEETKVIVAYVEGVKFGRELLKFLKDKPVVFIKAGRSKRGKRAAASHTGSLAGDFKLFKDVVETKGGIVVDSLEEAFDACEFLRVYGRLKGNKLLIVTNAGGPGTLASDYAEELGLELVSIEPVKEELSSFLPPNWSGINPVDLIGDATSDRYRKAFNVLEKLPWDACLVIVTPQSMTDSPEIAHEVVKFRNRTGKAVVGCFMGGHSVRTAIEILKSENLPVYGDPFRAVNSIRRGVWSVQLSSEDKLEKG